MNLAKIEEIYKNYGFEVSRDHKDIGVFLYKKGRYFGVDIIPLNGLNDQSPNVIGVQDYYAKIGYAINLKCLSSEEELEIELFKSFFSYESTISRLSRKYLEFEKNQTKSLLGNKYKYIESPYELYDGDISGDTSGLLDNILKILERSKPQLLILEAAAGYGKTCAAYEILNRIIENDSAIVTPLFTELSKNRGAKIFRYILLDEIDIEFPTLNSELVLKEIKNGRIPLIIDGFDELLEKVNVSNLDLSSAFDEVETMLDTIGNLLENKAKVILTTRKTAIFSGIEFAKWNSRWEEKFQVSRFSIREPRIKDWLGEKRFNYVKEKNIPIQYIANPVILTYLKNTSNDDFVNQIEDSELLIKNYFEKMLDRERERQNLIISVDKQYELFKNVAKMLLDLDITVESKEFFKEIIKDQNHKLLEYTRSLYTGQEKPTLENLVDTLATHALLDRKGRDEAQIGFINDFVFGILIGEIICESTSDKIERDYSFYMLDLACTAYKVQNRKNKSLLWEKVNLVKDKLQPVSVFSYDLSLKESLVRDYVNLSLYDDTFFNIQFKDHVIENSVFLNCYFKGCFFNIEFFKGVSFIDCTFDRCSVIENFKLDSSKEIAIVKCKVVDCEILEKQGYQINEEGNKLFNSFEEDVIITLMATIDSKSRHKMHLLHFYEKSLRKQVFQAIESLEKRDFIIVKDSHINININKLTQIKTELGI